MARCSWFSITNSLIQSITVAYGHTALRTPPSRLISEAKQDRAWLVLGWETTWEYQSYPEHRCRLRPYHPENARSRLISEAKQGRAWLVLGWETTWEYQHYKYSYPEHRCRLRPYHPENARSPLISEAKQGRAWLVLGWETTWEYQVLITNSLIQSITVAYGHTALRTPPSRLISEAKQDRAWLVLGWETTWEYQHYKYSYPEHRCRLRPYHPENARSPLISEAKQGRAWLVLGWETTWEYQVL
ncbi:hypothetical protein SRHO_G00122580 [Serrasalmus rhombeus]